jgi:hypothetical protein
MAYARNMQKENMVERTFSFVIEINFLSFSIGVTSAVV